MSITALRDSIDALVDSDPNVLGHAASIEALHRELARLDAVVTRATAAFDASGGWAPDGARDASAWLATKCRIPKSDARRRVRVARRLADLPAFTSAWLAGDVTAAHVGAVVRMTRPAVAEAVERDEEKLLSHALQLRFEWFSKVLRYFEQMADPDGVEEDELDRKARRDVYLTESFSGMWLGHVTLDPVSGAIVAGELARLEQAMFDADWAEASERLGREPLSVELCRTASQRRADALVEMATRSKVAPADGRRPAPLLSVLVGYETLHGRICELANGSVVTPGALLQWLDQALVERAVFGPDARVEIGPAVRLFTGATRRAIEIRDRTCAHPFCDRPASKCEIDHIVPYAAGGPTTQENGRLLCSFHNRLRNQRPPPEAA